MYEVELKVEADHGAVRARLRELDARQVGTVVQEDAYYDAPHRDFAETDEALRLRRERSAGEEGNATNEGDRYGDEHEWTTALTYKGPLLEAESKSREEFQSGLKDGPAVEQILERLGFRPSAVVRKERERYRLDGVTITLDDVEGLGQFVEAELESDTAGIEPLREQVADRLRTLDLDPTDQIRTSYLGLLLDGAGREQ